jgi:DnaK suppressor protein
MSSLDTELTDEMIKALRVRLMARLRELEAISESSREARSAVDLDQSRVGRLSRIDAIQMQAMEQAAEVRRERERERVLIALQRIESLEFGDCIMCGEEIAIKRLNYDPSLLTCVDCA